MPEGSTGMTSVQFTLTHCKVFGFKLDLFIFRFLLGLRGHLNNISEMRLYWFSSVPSLFAEIARCILNLFLKSNWLLVDLLGVFSISIPRIVRRFSVH